MLQESYAHFTIIRTISAPYSVHQYIHTLGETPLLHWICIQPVSLSHKVVLQVCVINSAQSNGLYKQWGLHGSLAAPTLR